MIEDLQLKKVSGITRQKLQFQHLPEARIKWVLLMKRRPRGKQMSGLMLRVIGLVRQKYTILQSTLPVDFLLRDVNESESSGKPLVNQMIGVCAALVNLCPPLI